MSSALDMSLDDMIKNSKKSGSANFRARLPEPVLLAAYLTAPAIVQLLIPPLRLRKVRGSTTCSGINQVGPPL
uniref:Uncharacterized protein n=1 Tax=Salix viminalis TaxID=40686 RepID=A0A6N2KMC4_SALVM